jgi:DNA-binding response OmpR family regulator
MLRAGADRYLTKPFSPHQLASLVDELLRDPVAPARAA